MFSKPYKCAYNHYYGILTVFAMDVVRCSTQTLPVMQTWGWGLLALSHAYDMVMSVFVHSMCMRYNCTVFVNLTPDFIGMFSTNITRFLHRSRHRL